MLLVAEKGREHEVLAVFEKWGPRLRRGRHGHRRRRHACLSRRRPRSRNPQQSPHRRSPPLPPSRRHLKHHPSRKDPPSAHPRSARSSSPATTPPISKRLLASPNICSKHWIYEQYDSMVQTNTVQGPGWRGRRHSHQSTSKRAPPSFERSIAVALSRQRPLVLSRPAENGRHARRSRSRPQGSMYRRHASRRDQLPQLRQHPRNPKSWPGSPKPSAAIVEACIALNSTHHRRRTPASTTKPARRRHLPPPPVIGVARHPRRRHRIRPQRLPARRRHHPFSFGLIGMGAVPRRPKPELECIGHGRNRRATAALGRARRARPQRLGCA